MRRWISWMAALTLVFGLAGPVRGEDQTDPQRGARLYSDNCGRCHNVRGPRQLSDRDWPTVMTHMRVIAGLPGDQARDIDAFLRASNNPPRRPLREEPALALSGPALIVRHGCRGCHVIRGEGGVVGPSLDGLFERRDPEWIRVQIQNPREHHRETVMPDFGLTDGGVKAIMDALKEPGGQP